MVDKEEHKEHDHPVHHVVHHEKKQMNVWMIATIVVTVILIAVLFGVIPKSGSSGTVLSEQAASEKVISYVDSLGATANVTGVEDKGDLYLMKLVVNGQPFESYLTKDGRMLFPSGIPLNQTIADKANGAGNETVTPVEPKTTVEKSDKPKVELFVMSYCPYGTQIEKGMVPVAELLGDKIDFSIKFCDYAMHGDKELAENMNQYCIQNDFSSKYFDYMKCFLNSSDSAACVKQVGISESKLASCVKDTDAKFNITKAAADKSTWKGNFPTFSIFQKEVDQYGVQGSPTLVINGAEASSARDSASLLKTICGAFTTAPKECDTNLSSASPSPGFGYAAAAAASSSGGCGG